jgi:hypothetical protein
VLWNGTNWDISHAGSGAIDADMLLGADAGRSLLAIAATQVALYNVFTAAGNPAVVRRDVTVTIGRRRPAGRHDDGRGLGERIHAEAREQRHDRGHWRRPQRRDRRWRRRRWRLGKPGQDGQPGGDAIALSYDLTIDNTSGNIFAGGGQGGGGAGAVTGSQKAGGGGGGGGRGYNNAAAGVGGGTGGGTDGSAGSAGSSGGGGGGGAGGVTSFASGGDGGNGGDWGQPGGGGGAGSNPGRRRLRRRGRLRRAQEWPERDVAGGFNGTQVKGGVA